MLYEVIMVRVPGGIEGLINKMNLTESREETYEDAVKKYTVGDKIKAVVVEISPEKQKVAFSIKDYKKKLQRDEISRYMTSEEEKGDGAYTLGDFLKNKNN